MYAYTQFQKAISNILKLAEDVENQCNVSKIAKIITNCSFNPIYNPPQTKGVKQLVNRNHEPVFKAARVQPKHLPASPHPQLTGTLGAAADDGHIVYALAVSWHKGDAGRPLGYVVHGLSYHGLVLRWK